MPDGTVYFGEIAYVSREAPEQVYLTLEDIPSEEPVEARERLVTAVRHGYGV